MDTVYKQKCDCTGCGLCKYICPNNAIEMKYDKEGFLYPVIDKNRCIDCKMCRNRCSNLNIGAVDNTTEFFAVKHKNDIIRANSTSGGLFTVLSDYFLENNGVVCGCVLDDDLNAVHIMAYNEDDRDLMRDSKYVQSDISNMFGHICKSLNEGKIVLFTGTPCQAEAVRKSTENNTNSHNLYICDIVCHGVPSPRIFQDYLKYLEKKDKIKIKKIKFRAKQLGWSKENKRMFQYEADNDIYYDDTFYKLYFNYNVISRPCCEKCKFTSTRKKVDFTIGDFWGIEKFYKNFDDGRGVSLLLIHSEKAKSLFDTISNNMDFIKSDEEKAISENPRLVTPTVFGDFRNQLFADYSKRGYGYIVKKYVNPSVCRRIVKKMKRIIQGVK